MNEELPIHPFSRLEAVGIVNGRPVYPIMGGSEDHEELLDGDEQDDLDNPDTEESDDVEDDDRPLGEKGEKALERIKEKEKAGRAEIRKLRQQVAELTKPAEDEEKTPEQIRAEIEAEVRADTDKKVVRAEVKSALKDRVADPDQFLRFLDLSQFTVTEDGSVDPDELDEFLELVPTAQGGKKFTPLNHGRPRKPAGDQLTREQLKDMSEDEIEEARRKGRLNDLLGIKK